MHGVFYYNLIYAGFKCSQYGEVWFYWTFYKNNILFKGLIITLEANLVNDNL